MNDMSSGSSEPLPLTSKHAIDRLTTFIFLWSGYIFFGQITIYYAWFQFSNRQRLGYDGLLTLLAFLSFLRPRSIALFAATLLMVNVNKWLGMPNHNNHGLFAFFVCFTLLAAIFKHVLSRGRLSFNGENRDALYREAAGLVRLELIILYFYVVLHKLNHDYFNTTVSCGVILYQEICERFTFMPQGVWVERMGLIGAIFLEAAIPLMLCIRRTRVLGIFVGMMFHLLLSLHENKFIYDFSAMLYALYFLFLPEEHFRVIREKVEHWLSSPRVRFWIAGWGLLMILAVVGVLYGGVIVAGAQSTYGAISRKTVIDALHDITDVMQHGFWFVLAAVVIATLGWMVLSVRREGSASSEQSRPERSIFAGALTPLGLILILVVFNGLCPYIGLKTESAFAMYSNLRTENGRTNHFFMPVRFRVAGYQEDLIEVIDSNDTYFRGIGNTNQGIPALEFRRRITRKVAPDFFATIREKGEVRTITAADKGKDPLFQPLSFPERRLLHFRNVQMWDGPQECRH